MNGPIGSQGPAGAQDLRLAGAGESRLSTLYGAAVSLLAGDGMWRAALAARMALEPHDTVLDIGCGGGLMCLALARAQPRAQVIGIDPRPALVAQARARAAEAGVRISYVVGDVRDVSVAIGQTTPTKIVLTLTGALSTTEKLARLQGARQIIDPAGVLHVADQVTQGAALLQRLFTAVAARDAGADAGPLIRAAGFVAVEETGSWMTPTGAVALHQARAS